VYIIITENTECDVHLNPQISKFSKVCYTVEAIMDIRSPHAMRGICFTNFHAHLRYSIVPIYSGCWCSSVREIS